MFEFICLTFTCAMFPLLTTVNLLFMETRDQK